MLFYLLKVVTINQDNVINAKGNLEIILSSSINGETIKQQNLIYKIFYESFYYTSLHFKEVRCLLIKLKLLIGKQYPPKFNLIFSLLTL